MPVKKMTVVCICMLALTFSNAQAQDWRGIVPLHSTCEDVKRILGVAKCEPVVNLESEIVNISFSHKPCADGWNVPAGTVISFTINPKKKSALADLNLDMTKYQKVVVVPYDQPGITHYWNAEEGVDLEIGPDGKVESITYGPTAKDSHLRYPNSLADGPKSEGDPGGSTKFDEYGHLPIKEEHKRLDDFAIQLRSDPDTKGYILGYAARRYRPGEMEARLERAKNYLAKRAGIDRGRIVTVNGGYREELSIELFVTREKAAAPIPFPTVCPSEVQIVKVGKMSSRRSHKLQLRQKGN